MIDDLMIRHVNLLVTSAVPVRRLNVANWTKPLARQEQRSRDGQRVTGSPGGVSG